MYRIKRTKNPPVPDTTPPAVHYAVSVAPEGNITGFTADVATAGLFDAETCGRVKAFYRAVQNAGKLDTEPVEPPKEQPVESGREVVAVRSIPLPKDIPLHPVEKVQAKRPETERPSPGRAGK